MQTTEISRTAARKQTRRAKKDRGGYLSDPRKARSGEVIGGGYWIFRRGDGTNRIRPSDWPFEHPTLASAQEHLAALIASNPGQKWVIAHAAFEIFDSPSA